MNLLRLMTFKRLQEINKARTVKLLGGNTLKVLGSNQGLGFMLRNKALGSKKMNAGGW